MTNNHLLLGVQVSFKGETHAFQANLDLDHHLRQYGALPDFHQWVATSNQVDAYSYLFEAMQMEPVEILSAQGRCAEFIQQGEFQTEAFMEDWLLQSIQPGLVTLAKTLLNTELDAESDLARALYEAYRLGLKQGQAFSRHQPTD